MAAFPSLLLVTAAILLCGAVTSEGGSIKHHKPVLHTACIYIYATHLCQTLADAQEAIRNFQAHKNSTHITFSWDIVDGYYSSSYINYFQIYYSQRPPAGYTSHIGTITYNNANLIKIGSSFKYTTSVTYLSSGQYVMWLYVYRPSLTPTVSYSTQICLEAGT